MTWIWHNIFSFTVFICQRLGMFLFSLVQQNSLTLWLVVIFARNRCSFPKLMFCYPSRPRPDALCEFPVICCWSCPLHSSHNSHAFAHTNTQNTYLCRPLLNICIVLWLIWLCWCFEQFLLLWRGCYKSGELWLKQSTLI